MSWKIITGDALKSLQTMESESVNTIVTSPPYYGLRDYGVPGQRGQEPAPEEFIEHLVDVFREARRTLKRDGTLWLNMGDSYAAGKCGRADHGSNDPTCKLVGNSTGAVAPGPVKARKAPTGYKPKDLIGIPWMLAFALRADGWYLRQDIVWNKPNAMPESVHDRCTRSHEFIFLLSKTPKYYYDYKAILEPAVSTEVKKFTDGGKDKQRGHSRRHAGFNGRYAEKLAIAGVPLTRNKRDVWTVGTSPYPEAHFAVFPARLIEPCVLAGCPEGGTVLDPFSGASTTGVVCLKNNRNYVGIELNPEYVEIATKRLNSVIEKQEAAA
jgi:DNA modification methylase